MICEKTNFMTRLNISFSFETMLKTILAIVWLISFFVISKKSILSEYIDLAISSRFATTSERKKESIKHWILVFLMKVIMSFERRKNDMISLNDVRQFFAHLTSFHVLWASFIASNTTFRWMIQRVFRMIRFLIAFIFFSNFKSLLRVFLSDELVLKRSSSLICSNSCQIAFFVEFRSDASRYLEFWNKCAYDFCYCSANELSVDVDLNCVEELQRSVKTRNDREVY
jgi:hypothetical protein